ncbi:MAG: hypothetical protein J7539_14730 [Niabella sp.]|nr:hypothetical protein [Niabella sp.]
MNWKHALQQARERNLTKQYAACRDFGVPQKRYSDKTANGLTACILDFLKYRGHYANRINTTGLPRIIKGKVIRTRGASNCGTADIHALIKGRFISIEIKIGQDRMSCAQQKEKARVEASGGTYITVKTMEQLYSWYEENFGVVS